MAFRWSQKEKNEIQSSNLFTLNFHLRHEVIFRSALACMLSHSYKRSLKSVQQHLKMNTFVLLCFHSYMHFYNVLLHGMVSLFLIMR